MIYSNLTIAVTGARGMLGTAILDYFSNYGRVYATSRQQGLCKKNIIWNTFDLLDSTQLSAWLNQYKPDVVIHCAAMVNLDQCEKEPENAFALHVQATQCIASIIRQWQGRLITISTDAVFDGKKTDFYTEKDRPCPINVYGNTKRQGEIETLNHSENNLVIRTTLIGHQKIQQRTSLSNWIVEGLMQQKKLTLFSDVYFTPIHTTHFTEILFQVINAKHLMTGIYHVSGSSMLSKYEFGLKLAATLNILNSKIQQSKLETVSLLANRPKNMTLSSQKLSCTLQIKLPNIQAGIDELKR